MKPPPALRFTDHIFTVPARGWLSLSEHRNGEWIYRRGDWRGRIEGRGYVVQVMVWRSSFMIEFIHGRQYRRRWDEAPSDKTISRRCRQFVHDVLAGRIGAVGLNAQ